MVKILINVRIEEKEDALLEAYCNLHGRTKTDVIREYIRSLSKKMKKTE
jgi:hypothetical protein